MLEKRKKKKNAQRCLFNKFGTLLAVDWLSLINLRILNFTGLL